MAVIGTTPAGFTPPSRKLARQVAIVGVGDTDYGDDYRAARLRAPGYEPPETLSLCKLAFERALSDSGLRRDDIDGLSLSLIYGGADLKSVSDALEIAPDYAVARGTGVMDDVIPAAVEALYSGKCRTIVLVYAAASRAIGRLYGGETYAQVGNTPKSYYYFSPWGWTSQAAHWAFIWQYYRNVYGAKEEDLASVAMTLRRHAARNENAIMREPLTLDAYLDSRYIVKPMHLFDMCLVNDGGVCLILRRTDMAADLGHTPVEVAGWAHAKAISNKMDAMVRERFRPYFQEAGRQAFAMADLALSDVDHFQGYDASSIHLISQLEGYGFAEPGTGLEFCQSGKMDLDGALPVNTSGGMLSESYMHGWNHVVEAVRQLRHEAGARQVADIQTSMFSMATTETAHPLLLTRGA
jgi:acetyl-CoA acetyltransferase